VLIQKVAEMSWRRGTWIRILIRISGACARILSAIRAAILPVPGALAVVILRILLIRPLLVLILRLLILILPLLVLIRLILIRPLLILVLPLLVGVLPLLVGVDARRILDLAGTALRRSCTRTILTEEPRPHGRTGTELSATLTVQASRGQTEKQDRSGDRRRWTHSFRVQGPVHRSFSKLETNISKNQSPLGLLERASIWSST
jgi:hypothetical protein